LSVTGQHANVDALTFQFLHRLGRSRLYLVGNGDNGKYLCSTAKVNDTVPVRFVLHHHLGKYVRKRSTEIFQQFVAAHPISVTLIYHLDTFSGDTLKTLQLGRNYLLHLLQRRDNGSGKRMFGFKLGCQQNILEMLFLYLGPKPSGDSGVSLGQCPGFVEHHYIDFTHLLEGNSILYQNMVAGCFADTHHQSGRSSKSQSTRTGNDQYGYSRKQGM